MRLTVAFEVRNTVSVLEGWPITRGDMTFHLERRDNRVRNVCITFAGVDIKYAPTFSRSVGNSPANLKIDTGGYTAIAIRAIMSWQATIAGVRIFDIDFDAFELRFNPETLDEEEKIPLRSFSPNTRSNREAICDFEQIGRAFCVGNIEDKKIESISHFRDGRLAYESGRFIDAYNHLYLFLESRYCDGKYGNKKHVKLLSSNPKVISSIDRLESGVPTGEFSSSEHLNSFFDASKPLETKVKELVLLRGKLRHRSEKNPDRWDPNKQGEFEEPARLLSVLVGHIVTEETLSDIYSQAALEEFRSRSIESGNELKFTITSRRLEKLPALQLSISVPTVLASTAVCLLAIRSAIDGCEKENQLGDTVSLDAITDHNQLELFQAELGVWAYTEDRVLRWLDGAKTIRCAFEHNREGTIVTDEFELSASIPNIDIERAWGLLRYCLRWIEEKDPTTRILKLGLHNQKSPVPFLNYRVGAQSRY